MYEKALTERVELLAVRVVLVLIMTVEDELVGYVVFVMLLWCITAGVMLVVVIGTLVELEEVLLFVVLLVELVGERLDGTTTTLDVVLIDVVLRVRRALSVDVDPPFGGGGLLTEFTAVVEELEDMGVEIRELDEADDEVEVEFVSRVGPASSTALQASVKVLPWGFRFMSA